jgi:hypothetical protein
VPARLGGRSSTSSDSSASSSAELARARARVAASRCTTAPLQRDGLDAVATAPRPAIELDPDQPLNDCR